MKREDMKDFVVHKLDTATNEYRYMTNVGWSSSSKFATRFTFAQVATIHECIAGIGYETILTE